MAVQLDTLQTSRFSSLEFLARQVVEGFITGLHKSPFHGFSVEFAEHRLYNTGESTRHIDWKLYARTDKLFVKRYEEETNLRCQLVVDASPSMYYPAKEDLEKGLMNKITFAAYAAASLTELFRRQRDAVGLSVFEKDLALHTPSRSNVSHHKMIYHELEKLLSRDPATGATTTAAAESLHIIADAVHKRSLVIILSDMLDNREGDQEIFSALRHLKHNRHEVILFHVQDRTHEIAFDFGNRPYRFVDMESGEEVKLFSGEIREAYQKAALEREKDLKLKAAQYGIDFIEADIRKGFDQVLMGYLMRRAKMV